MITASRRNGCVLSLVTLLKNYLKVENLCRNDYSFVSPSQLWTCLDSVLKELEKLLVLHHSTSDTSLYWGKSTREQSNCNESTQPCGTHIWAHGKISGVAPKYSWLERPRRNEHLVLSHNRLIKIQNVAFLADRVSATKKYEKSTSNIIANHISQLCISVTELWCTSRPRLNTSSDETQTTLVWEAPLLFSWHLCWSLPSFPTFSSLSSGIWLGILYGALR